jgi:flavorubredoxin
MQVELKPGIYWVGAIDWNVRDFHGYSTHRGTTYNAYLVRGEKTALIDTVKAPFFDEMWGRIEKTIDPREIRYIVVNHVEMDHSGALLRVREKLPQAEILCSPRGLDALKLHYGSAVQAKAFKTGESLDLGGKTLSFAEIPMVHWPDSMVTYVKEDKVLLPNDAFGQHIASSERFDDEIDLPAVIDEARKYYANIVMPYGAQVLKALDALKGLEIDVIGPSHGIIWRSHIPEILSLYQRWARGETRVKAVIAYDTMWGSTEKMAQAIEKGLVDGGVQVRVYRLSDSDKSDIVKELLEAKALLAGSPTLNNNLFPSVAEFLTYVKGLRPKGRVGAAFGSYGWAPGVTKTVAAELQAAGVDVAGELAVRYVPDADTLKRCEELGREIATKIKAS